jgi:hypothetical protein
MQSEQETRLQAIKEEQKRLKREILASSKKKDQPEKTKEKTLSLLEEQRAKYLDKRKGTRKPDEKMVG